MVDFEDNLIMEDALMSKFNKFWKKIDESFNCTFAAKDKCFRP